jgi:hypothetical protein
MRCRRGALVTEQASHCAASLGGRSPTQDRQQTDRGYGELHRVQAKPPDARTVCTRPDDRTGATPSVAEDKVRVVALGLGFRTCQRRARSARSTRPGASRPRTRGTLRSRATTFRPSQRAWSSRASARQRRRSKTGTPQEPLAARNDGLAAGTWMSHVVPTSGAEQASRDERRPIAMASSTAGTIGPRIAPLGHAAACVPVRAVPVARGRRRPGTSC